MFFGAGNLIFPLIIGKSAGHNVWFAISGLLLTAVAVPFLGLISMLLFHSDYNRFFGRLGRIPGLLLLLLCQLILGPIGVIPRLITLMHATAKPFLFGMPLFWFSILAVALIFACSFQRNQLIKYLGAYLTPLLILSLAALLFFGLTSGSFGPISTSASDSFLQGLIGGYNTMDLIAAFLFATVVLPHFQKRAESEHPSQRKNTLFKEIVFSSSIAAALLLLTYVGLCLISARHGWALDPACPAEGMLTAIALKLLGPTGSLIAAIAVITACLTTAMTLTSIFADYLRKDVCKEKISPTGALAFTLLVTTLFANLGFGGISAFLAPILQIVYPGLILLATLNLFHALYGHQMVRLPVFSFLTGSTIFYLVQI